MPSVMNFKIGFEIVNRLLLYVKIKCTIHNASLNFDLQGHSWVLPVTGNCDQFCAILTVQRYDAKRLLSEFGIH